MPSEPAPPLPEPVRTNLSERTSVDALELPMLPQTASRVLSLCNDEQCDARQLAELIERDQSLAAQVLKIANSAAFAPNQTIVSLQQAVARLGHSTLCEIAVGVALKGEVFDVPGFEDTIRDMWRHSAAAGAFAKEIARAARRNVEGAFLCGLLHDVGKPIVLQNTVAVLQEAGVVPDDSMLEVSLDEFHGTVGGMLIEHWGLAPWIAVAAEFHHEPEEAPDHALEANVTQLADELAHWALGTRDVSEEDVRTSPALSELDLYEDDVERLLAARDGVLEVAEAFA
jgi:HD-like signal output (HDOD) protein